MGVVHIQPKRRVLLHTDCTPPIRQHGPPVDHTGQKCICPWKMIYQVDHEVGISGLS